MKCYHCEHYDNKTGICYCDGKVVISPWSDAECDYLKEPPTNGDIVRRMSNGVFAFFMTRLMVDGCPIGKNKPFNGCKISNDCTNCLKAWLNATAGSEGRDEQ